MSVWGPTLVTGGVASLVAGAIVHGVRRRPHVFAAGRPGRGLVFWERVSVHLIAYGIWGVCFGTVIWRGVPTGAIDIRFDFERRWPVVNWAVWIYVTVYLVPIGVPWLARSRAVLRAFAWRLIALSGVSFVLYLALPWVAYPRAATASSISGRLLAWETARDDFAAASIPSFHVFWALLCAGALASLGNKPKWLANVWAGAVAFACVATGAHAIADVAASLVIYPLVAWCIRVPRDA